MGFNFTSSHPHLVTMKTFLLLSFLVAAQGLPAPQEPSLDLIQDVFGSSTVERYGGVADSSQNVQDTVNDIVGSNGSSGKFVDNVPNDYVEPANENLRETVTVEVLADNEDCASYTASLGYMCVPYYQCSNGTIITDGAGLIDIRNGFGALDAQDGKCPGFLDVCCKDPDFIPPPPQPQPYQARCGRRNQNGLGVRIQGFEEGESQVGEWPHMCALIREEIVAEEPAEGYEGGEIKSTTINHFFCGASLIEPGVVLTGAHCVAGFNNNEILKVRCGEWDTQTETEAYPHQDRYVSNFVVHPLFNGQNLFHDYAILFTTADFTMDHNVDTICLPQPEETFVSEDCFATGWGKDKFGKGKGKYGGWKGKGHGTYEEQGMYGGYGMYGGKDQKGKGKGKEPKGKGKGGKGSKGKGVVCFNCGQSGHIARDCPDPNPYQGTYANCGHWGHIAKFCNNTSRLQDLDEDQDVRMEEPPSE